MKKRKLPLGELNTIGANLTRIRLDKGIMQKDLLAKLQAEGMDITGSTLSKIEGQSRMITDKELLIITRALHIEIDALIDKDTVI